MRSPIMRICVRPWPNFSDVHGFFAMLNGWGRWLEERWVGGYLLRNGSCLWIQVCMGLFGFGPSWFVKAYTRFVLRLHNIEDKCYNLQNNPHIFDNAISKQVWPYIGTSISPFHFCMSYEGLFSFLCCCQRTSSKNITGWSARSCVFVYSWNMTFILKPLDWNLSTVPVGSSVLWGGHGKYFNRGFCMTQRVNAT